MPLTSLTAHSIGGGSSPNSYVHSTCEIAAYLPFDLRDFYGRPLNSKYYISDEAIDFFHNSPCVNGSTC